MSAYFSQLMQHHGIRTAQAPAPRDERHSAQVLADQRRSATKAEEPITALFETEQEEALWPESPKPMNPPAQAHDAPLLAAAPTSARADAAPAPTPLSSETAKAPSPAPMGAPSDPNPLNPRSEQGHVQPVPPALPVSAKADAPGRVEEVVREVVPPLPTPASDVARQVAASAVDQRTEQATAQPSLRPLEKVRPEIVAAEPQPAEFDQAALEATVFQQVLNWVSRQPSPQPPEPQSLVSQPSAQPSLPRAASAARADDPAPQSAAVLKRDPSPSPVAAPPAPLRLEIGSIKITVESPKPFSAPASAAPSRPSAYLSPFGSSHRFRRFYF